jgi:hypothetical protein
MSIMCFRLHTLLQQHGSRQFWFGTTAGAPTNSQPLTMKSYSAPQHNNIDERRNGGHANPQGAAGK